MLNLYRYMLDNNMKTIDQIPSPYKEMLIAEGYGAPVSE
jgi:hypothetical protein